MGLSRIGLSLGFAACLATGAAGLAVAQTAPAAGAIPDMNAPLPTAPDDIVAFRQARYKWMGDAFGNMKKVIDAGGDVAPLAADAAAISAWGHRIPTVFPVGTETAHNTKALPAVWSDRATFTQRAAALETEAGKLSTVAAGGDKAAFAAQYQTTGGACGACHRQFRGR